MSSTSVRNQIRGAVTTYAAKVLDGQEPSDDDWNEHLLYAHRVAPGRTPEFFLRGEVLDGTDSYELVAGALRFHQGPVRAVLDLGCGDGHLIDRLLRRLGPQTRVLGVDMSEAELAIARRRLAGHANVELLCERAQHLSLPSRSVDVVLCHAALMVMRPLVPALAEVARVLEHGGLFAAMTASPRAPEGITAELSAVIQRFFRERHAGMVVAPARGAEVTQREGLQRLFSGFASLEICDEHHLRQRYPVEDVWLHWRDAYLVSLLDEPSKARLSERLVDFAAAHAGGDGFVELETPIQLLFARTRSDEEDRAVPRSRQESPG